jgi:ADP-heptose:LPS heptosyltransferase
MSLFTRRRQRPENFQRIGILVSPTLGDTILNSAALQDIRAHYPDARILYFSTPTNGVAVKLLDGIDEIVPINVTKPWETLRTIRNCKLDLLVDFTSWQRLTAFFSALSGAKYRVGYRTPNQYRHWHYDLTADHSAKLHEVDNYRSLIRALGVKTNAEPRLSVTRPARISGNSDSLFVFHPWATGDKHALREWPNDKWVEFAMQFKSLNPEIVITGAPAQGVRSQQLCEQLHSAGLNAKPFVGSNGLDSLCTLLCEADLVVSVNTGVMHLAAVIGAPTIGLNGPNSSHRWGPVGPLAVAVDPHGGKGGFLHLGFEFDGNPTDCMERTRVQDVVDAALKLVPELGRKIGRLVPGSHDEFMVIG